MIKYDLPGKWMLYDPLAVMHSLVEAKAAVLTLTSLPYQRTWVEALQKIQLKREVAGTLRIEGADFTENELDAALKDGVDPKTLLTRSQKQAYAAVETYRWISTLPNDRPIDGELIREVHAHIVTGCDDDHCPPARLRERDQNVIFGAPKHRGVEGGEICKEAFDKLTVAVQGEFHEHDLLVQALALHYHFAAMHPFLDGNGRTARALEALVLQRAGIRDTAFIAMSNYYYDEKNGYLESLSLVRAQEHDLTPFLIFGLKGITIQCRRLSEEIKKNLDKALFKNVMYDLFNRLETTRKRVIKDRQLEILKLLLEVDEMDFFLLLDRVVPYYGKLQEIGRTFARDIRSLEKLGAIEIELGKRTAMIRIRLQWPTEITESEFFERIEHMPKGKTYRFLS
jgi:Fic family protein